jgi:hypothetical protein
MAWAYASPFTDRVPGVFPVNDQTEKPGEAM